MPTMQRMLAETRELDVSELEEVSGGAHTVEYYRVIDAEGRAHLVKGYDS